MLQIKAPDLGSLEYTIRALIECKTAGVGAYLGGSCTETGVSARVCKHVAIATQTDVTLAKPGMGVDEGSRWCATSRGAPSPRSLRGPSANR